MDADVKAKGLTWDDPKLAEIREDWEGYVQEGRLTDAKRLIRQVKSLEAKPAAPPAPTKPAVPVNRDGTLRKSPDQRSAEMDMSGGPNGGTGVRVTSDNIDKLKLDWDRQHPGQTNPYEETYRRFLATGEIGQ